MQLLSSRHDQADLRTARNQDDIRLAVRRIGHDVCTVTQTIRRGKLGAIERGHILTRQNQCNWMVFRLQRDAPSDGRLIGIARTNDREAGTARRPASCSTG